MNEKMLVKFMIIVISVNVIINTFNHFIISNENNSINYVPTTKFEIDTATKNVNHECETTVFIGDSITEGYNLNYHYENNYINSGVSGDTTINLYDKLEENLFKYNPNCIVILIGTNDYPKNYSVNDIIYNIDNIFHEIKIKLPDSKVYVQSIYPVNKVDTIINTTENRDNEVIDETNILLHSLTKSYNYEFLNINKYLKDELGNLNSKYTYDGLHLSYDGYVKITEELKKLTNLK